MLTKTTAESVLREALRTGGDFAEIFCEDRRSGSMGLVDGRVEAAATVRRHGAGIRVYRGLNSVYVHTNDTAPSGLLAAARKAADAVEGGAPAGDVHLTRSIQRNIHRIEQMPMDVAGARKAKLLRDCDLAAKAVSPEITQVRASLTHTSPALSVTVLPLVTSTFENTLGSRATLVTAVNGSWDILPVDSCSVST